MVNVNATLAERGSRYGRFRDQAIIAQNIKDDMRNTPGWERLAPDMRECLDMIANKTARILNGDPEYADSWHDIAGYAQLVEQELENAGQLNAATSPFQVGEAVQVSDIAKVAPANAVPPGLAISKAPDTVPVKK